MKFYKFLFLLLLIFPFQIINCQEEDNAPTNLKFQHFSTKEGLSQRSVVEIFQDKKGYLWFGTREGLNKYDGEKFISYRHNSDDPNSLSNSWITSIFEDTQGNLWIGTRNGLNKYNPQKDSFIRYKHSTNKNSLTNNTIWDLTQIDENFLWIATNNGIDRLDINENTFTHLKHHKKDNNTLSNNQVRSFLKSVDGKLWISNIKNIDLYDSKNKTFTHYKYPIETSKDYNLQSPPTLFRDSKNTILLGSEKGLSYFDESKSSFVEFQLNNSSIVSGPVRSICEDRKGNIWIGTYTGLTILNPKTKTFKHFCHNENDPKSLSQNSIHKITKDSKGDIWIGTWAGGINYFEQSYDIFKQFSVGQNNSMLNYNVISSIIETPNSDLLIGTEGGGINHYHKKIGKFTYYLNNPEDKNSLSSNNVKVMIRDHEGNLWIGTHDGGLNFLNLNEKPYKFKHFDDAKHYGINTTKNEILTLLEDSNHNIWLGTTSNGILIYNRKTAKITKLNNTANYINLLYQSKDPDYVLINDPNGISKINIHSKEKTLIPYSQQFLKEDQKITANCIFEAPNSNYWIGTEGKGLYFYNSKTKETEKFGIGQGLPNEVIYGILPDDNGNIWFSTNKGISQLNTKTKKIKNFDETNGLQSNEFNYQAFLKTKNGELIFGGTNGLNYFNPNKITENNFIPSVDIYAIHVSNKPYLKITDSISKITLKHNQNDFNIDFTALSYSQSNKNQFEYKLEGFDEDWNYIGNKKSANYTNLDQGNYTFRVKASNNDGLWNEKGDSVKISILPAPWKTWWAYLFYLLTFSILIYYVRILTMTRIRVRNELKQEKLENERIEEINKLKLKLFTNISHDFRTPLTLITGPVEQLLKMKNNSALATRNIQSIQRNTNILLQLINELLDFRKNDSGKLELQASKNEIIPYIKNIKLAFEELANQRNISYNFTYENEALEVWFDKIKLKKILFNLLSNAFKFTSEKGEISIHISTETKKCSAKSTANHAKIEITNFRKPIPEKDLKFIFDRFYQLEQKGVEFGTGIGLSLVKNLTTLHKGTISVTSSEKGGTCFVVLLPLGKEHLSEKQLLTTTEETSENALFDKPAYVLKELRSKEIELENADVEFDETLPTLLLVEDNIELRNFIKNIFKDKYNTFEASNGKGGLELAAKKPIDLIISDIMMPIMDGYQFSKEIKTNIVTSHIPIILLTAKTADEHRKEGYFIGADAYITKPFDPNILEIRVDNLLKSRRNLIKKFKQEIILKPKELTATSADEKFLEAAIKVVEENMSDPEFGVYTFSDQMFMSRSVLYRKLKALTGQSISSFIRTMKIKKAGQLLIQTNMSVSEITYEVGFNDLKHFRKCFKTHFNESASNYRKKNTP